MPFRNTKNIDFSQMQKFFTETGFWDKIRRFAKKAGIKVTYTALLLYYLMKDENVPSKTKIIIAGALGYFILPVDFVLDAIPLVGFVDDIGVLLLALNHAAKHVKPEMQEQAKKLLTKWFGSFDDADVEDIDNRISPAG